MPQPSNLLELAPAREADWDDSPDGRVVVKAPKFTGRLGRWLGPHLRKPYVSVRLDAEGSFVWRHCDGVTTVAEIAERMHRELGVAEDALYPRIAVFLQQLERGGLVRTTPRAHPIGDHP